MRSPAAKGRPSTRSGGPDTVHLCLMVDKVPHLFGCAWASYGEARLPLPASCARPELFTFERVYRARIVNPKGT